MILTACAACAAPLAHTAPQCGRCQTRYCGRPCQVQHWEEGGHKALCKKIKKGGGAEQYHADKNYKEAVAEAVEECAEDTKGQTCFICTQALHLKTKEGLVRSCACRGTSGFAHVSCLVEQAKILFAEAEENNLGEKAKDERWARWKKCSLCEQQYHGVVEYALGWGCWKTYLGRPETDVSRRTAVRTLAIALSRNGDDETALAAFEAHLGAERRFFAANWEERSRDDDILTAEKQISHCYAHLGRHYEAITLRRSIYERRLAKHGPMDVNVLNDAMSLAFSLVSDYFFEEAKTFLRDIIPRSESVLGNQHHNTLAARRLYAKAVYTDAHSSLDEQREAIATLEDCRRIGRQVFGNEHPICEAVDDSLVKARERLSLQEARLVEDASEKLAQGLRIDGDDESDAP